MSELVSEATNEEHILFTREIVDRAVDNVHVIGFIKTKFKRLSTLSAKLLIRKIMYFEIPIKAEHFSSSSSFHRYNLGKFDDDKCLKKEVVKELREELKSFIEKVAEKDLDDYDLEKHQHILIKDGDKFGFILDKTSTYNKMQKKLCEEKGKVFFKYDFDKADLEVKEIEDHDGLQRAKLQVISKGYEFNYAVEYFYHCPECSYDSRELAYAVESTKNKIKCEGIKMTANSNGEMKPKICRNVLSPDYHSSVYKKAFFFFGRFLAEGGIDSGQTFSCVSFNDIVSGFYDSVFYKIPDSNAPSTYIIMDCKREAKNHITFPEQNLEENYVFTLQKFFDNFIKEKSGLDIYGLKPIKVALIFQKLINELDLDLVANIQLAGDASCLPKGTKIKTPSGFKPIEEVNEVLSYDFNKKEVVKTHCNNIHIGKKKIINIYTSEGVVESSYDHLWYVRTKEDKIIIKKAKNIVDTDCLLMI